MSTKSQKNSLKELVVPKDSPRILKNLNQFILTIHRIMKIQKESFEDFKES